MVYIIFEYLIVILYIMYKLLSICISKFNDIGYYFVYMYVCIQINIRCGLKEIKSCEWMI